MKYSTTNRLRSALRTILTVTFISAPLMLGALSQEAIAGERQANRANQADNQRSKPAHRDSLRKKESGTYTSTTTRTGPNGQSTRETTAVVDREAGTLARDTTITGPNGKTATVHADVAKTEDGYTRDVTRTGPNGKTSTTNTEMVRTENGRSIDTTHTGPNGKTSTRSTDVVRSDDSVQRTTVATAPNGESRTTVTTRTVTPTP